MSNICALCRGSGNLFCVQAGAFEWWPCPACDGDGVRALHGPPTIRTHFRSEKQLKGLARIRNRPAQDPSHAE